MTAMSIVDLQSSQDHRNLPVDRVGIKDYQHPVMLADKGQTHPSVATFHMMVSLPSDQKGTHMSRFLEILHEGPVHLGVDKMAALLDQTATRLQSESAYIEAHFPFFRERTAPASGTKSLMNYQVSLLGELSGGHAATTVRIEVPVTSLCPCSKAISDYGAHNQRAHIIVTATLQETLWIDDLIDAIESNASSTLYTILKRPDEKYVTEQAYDNPKFVEDIVRDVATTLGDIQAISGFSVESHNFESIHNHAAYAMIRR